MSMHNRMRSLLPELHSLKIETLSQPISLIGAAGFEDRALSFLGLSISNELKFEKALAIKYLPFDKRNKLAEFEAKIAEVEAITKWITYNRYDPQKFVNSINSFLDFLDDSSIVVDVSGMSKLLIMIILQALRNKENPVHIIYSEAEIYHPTFSEFMEKKKKLGVSPDFLTSNVFKILNVSSLSSVSMQGHPILLITFPTFNHNELVALQNELSPKHMLLLEGMPHENKDKWRLEAIREINRKVLENPDYSKESRIFSTFDYQVVVHRLEEIYQKYSFTHKILLSPTGSKLQTIASFIFRQLHPDVQIVYPVTKSFIGEYSEKCRAIWQIYLENYSKFIAALSEYRKFQ